MLKSRHKLKNGGFNMKGKVLSQNITETKARIIKAVKYTCEGKEDKIMLDKVKAVMIGHAVGDALGVPVEFASRLELDKSPVVDMEEGGTYNMPKGTWSDDTSMSLATLDGLANGNIDYNDIMIGFCDWFDTAKYTPADVVFDIGRGTMKSLISYMRGEAEAIDCGQKSELDNGNGSLMRIHPIVLYLANKDMSIKEKIEIIHNVSALTHGHIRSKIACGIYAFVLWELLNNPSLDSIRVGLDNAEKFYKGEAELKHYNRIFCRTFTITKRDDIKSSGYVVDTLEAALWCLLTTSSYKDCVLKAVNLGGDTDTVAAIAGGLAGGVYGYEAIPQNWRNTLIKRDYIEQLCEKAFYK